MFQGPHNRRANRDNTPASHPSMTDRQGNGWRNVVWFVKRQKRIQLVIASRRDARGVSYSRELNSLSLQGCQGVPVKGKAGRGGLERYRWTRDRCPHVPERQ